MDHAERQVILDRHATMLREHFDSVQIIAVRHDDSTDVTARHASGCGSWHERYGSTKLWLLRSEAVERLEAKQEFESDGEDGE